MIYGHVLETHTPNCLVGLQLSVSNIISELKGVSNTYMLAIHLGIDEVELDDVLNVEKIEEQKINIINHWLSTNKNTCSWNLLANAVKKTGDHGNLVKRLKDHAKHY